MRSKLLAMKPLCVLVLLSLGCLAQEGKQVPATPGCVATSFNGQVKRGLPFIQTIGNGLTYQLIPVEQEATDPTHSPKFIGWTIRIAYLKNRGEMERDFTARVAPYQGSDPGDLSTRNGQSVKEILRLAHDVFFLTNLVDFANAKDLLEDIQQSDSSFDSKRPIRELRHIPVGFASFTIIDQQSEGDPAAPTGIQALSFKVDLVISNSIKLPLDLASRAQPATCPLLPSAISLQGK
jgi:hypothetical protein